MEYSNVFELLPDESALLLKAGMGWGGRAGGPSRRRAEGWLSCRPALLVREPVVIGDFGAETRFARRRFCSTMG